MSIVASQLVAEVKVSGAQEAEAQLTGVGAASDGAGFNLQKLAGGALLAAGVAIVAIGAKSVQMAANFQSSLTGLVTGAGEAQSNIKMVGDGILQMAVDTGSSTKTLTDGMFMIESAGYHGAQGLDVLKVAAEGARVGNADLGVVANAMTTYMQDYHVSADHAATAMNWLTAVVANGKTHLKDLASSMSGILPVASAYGISAAQVGGALATMTNAGMSAQNASHNLANALRSLEAPGGAAQKAMKGVGLSANEVHDAIVKGGLPAAFQLITDEVGKKFPAGSAQYNIAMKSIMGGATGLNVALMLGGKNADAFKSAVKSVGDALVSGGNSVTGWTAVQGDFNFQMDKAKEVVETLIIKVGTMLLPVLGKLLGVVTPLISQFGTWITSSHGLAGVFDTLGKAWQGVMKYLNGDAFQGFVADLETLGQQISSLLMPAFSALAGAAPSLGDALSGIGNAIAWIIDKVDIVVFSISQLIFFFQQNQTAADVLIGVLAGVGAVFTYLGAVALVEFLATIPALITGFVAWATTAGAAAVATIAATWPLILLGVAVAAVVAGIILAIQHWGEITNWLKTTWGAIGAWFQSVLGKIGGFFTDMWKGIQAGTSAAMGWLGSAIQTGMKAVFDFFMTPIYMLVDGFKWLYNHNYYFKDLVDSIIKLFTQLSAWLSSTWKFIVDTLTGWWKVLVGGATLYWNQITSSIQHYLTVAWDAIVTVWNTITGYLASVWQQVSSVVSTAWNTVTGLIRSAWNTISGIIGGAWNTYIAGPLGGLWNQFTGWFGNLAHQALTWGGNLISMFAQGITSGTGSVMSAVTGIASNIAKSLGFHSPTEEGPGRDADTWAPNLMRMFTAGLLSGQGDLKNAVNATAGILAGGLNANVSSSLSTSVRSSPFASGVSGVASVSSSASGAAGGSQQPIILQLDGRQFATLFMPYMVSAIRNRVGTVGF